jgi:LmbE family N-acetylglucosaminyl deacetylase
MQTAMVISPHADDAAAFCGATLAKFADLGWRVVLVRVTDDAKDSVGLSPEETIQRNTEELHKAAEILGISEIVELGYETDCLGDVSKVELRERFVYLFRKYRPYAVFTFDPEGKHENNLDHIVVAQTVDEAFWVACFDKHHPEHFNEGLEPFSVCERWYFARESSVANHGEDVTEYLERKVEALCAHRTMMQNVLNQYRLQLATWGRRMAWLEDSMEGDMRPLLALAMQMGGNAVAEQFNLGPGRMGEAFRLVRFGDFEELFQALAEPLPDAQEAPKRESLDLPPYAPPWSKEQLAQIFPRNLNQRLSLMGHHHLCAGAFEELLRDPGFSAEFAELVSRLEPSPDLEIESIYGYDVFCYQCSYWSEEEGRCSTGWKNKITKDAAVLEHLGLQTGQVTPLEDLQRLLAKKVLPTDLERFCAAGDWKCEFYILGACQKAYAQLRDRLGIELPDTPSSKA